VKAAEDEQDDLRGRLGGAERSTEALGSFAERMAAAMEKLGATIGQARDASAKDPVLLEHEAATGGADAA
jgi:hypothetical protein